MILVAKFGEANHELHCDFKITAQPKKEYFDGDYEVDITENGTTTLLTEGKYCDRNIDINVNVESSGGTEIEDGLISGTLSGAYRNDRVTTVRKYGLAYTNLTSIDLPNVTTLRQRAISYNDNLTEVNLPKFAPPYNADTYLLGQNKALQSISLLSATALPMYCLADNSALVNIDIPLVREINSYAFTYCIYL